MERQNFFDEFEGKMRAAGSSPAAIDAFRYSYSELVAGKTGLIPENEIEPVTELPCFEEVQRADAPAQRLAQTVIIKLNGGLGTSMGLETAKCLLPIKGEVTFLDFIARQILHLRRKFNTSLHFLLMNSFSTSADTRAFLQRYPELGAPESLELMQNAVAKVDAQTLRPASRPENPQLEWCPPGHGDLYPALLGSGWLERLLSGGVKYLFVSNADNLGASLDLSLLHYFAESGAPFLMEVAERTAADRKGGHLALRHGQLVLRESAQCPEGDLEKFQDVARHRFFNTNNLWIRLDAVQQQLERHGGFIPLPVIMNTKTVDPRDSASPRVFQLETAMGAAIECFDKAGAIVVPRTRFAPVKTTADLLGLRSDAYEVTEDWRLVLSPRRNGEPPGIDLDTEHYKLVDQLDRLLAGGVPSLMECRKLGVRGPIVFQKGIVFKGAVELRNKRAAPHTLTSGVYEDVTLEFE